MAKKRLESNRTGKKIFVSSTGVEVITKPCRKCREVKKPQSFFKATDPFLDTDGLFSVCKSCFTEVFDAAYVRERTINRAILDCCRTLNIRYHEPAVESVLANIKKAEDAGKKPRPALSTYMQRVFIMVSRGQGIEDPLYHELTFFEPTNPLVTEDEEAMMSQDKFWGESIPLEDVEFLEGEYGRLRAGSPPENYAETVLIKQVCYKLLEIKKSRETDKKKLGTLEKQLLVLMKELAISPAHANAASGGKSIDTYGMWIADIERYSPAEWLEHEGKNMFHDVDDVDFYFQKYIVRPIKNFVTGQAEYSIMEEGDEENGEQLSIEQ